MNAWTAERLDALPEGTLIEWTEDGGVYLAAKEGLLWGVVAVGEVFDSDGIAEDADPGSIRVVSVPIAALLSGETLSVALEAGWVPDGFGSWSSERVVRAAVAHVTGETP